MGISVRHLKKRFNDFAALSDVSLDVPDGSLTALLGPSGSGKSTLLRVIAGLEQPDEGEVLIGGEVATSLPPQRRNVGFVFQHYAAFKHMTVRDNIGFGLRIRKRPKAEIRKRVDELLHLVQLDGFAERYPAQLSGGQRQRMALARSLAVEPRVLLLDEPFGALDARVREELREWLRRLHDQVHVTTVLVTHDQEEAMEVASRIVVMNHGKIEQVGTPLELYEHPATEFVMSFVGKVNRLGDTYIRPHEVVVCAPDNDACERAFVERLVTLGFETRAELRLGDGQRVWAQLPLTEITRLGLQQGQTVGVDLSRSRRIGWQVVGAGASGARAQA
jgi:sulfate transport system ATP-binding protein